MTRTFTSTQIDEAIELQIVNLFREIEELGLDDVEFHQLMEAVHHLDTFRADFLNVACKY